MARPVTPKALLELSTAAAVAASSGTPCSVMQITHTMELHLLQILSLGSRPLTFGRRVLLFDCRATAVFELRMLAPRFRLSRAMLAPLTCCPGCCCCNTLPSLDCSKQPQSVQQLSDGRNIGSLCQCCLQPHATFACVQRCTGALPLCISCGLRPYLNSYCSSKSCTMDIRLTF